jgi:outer membrane receptor protein involved in Fe transport
VKSTLQTDLRPCLLLVAACLPLPAAAEPKNAVDSPDSVLEEVVVEASRVRLSLPEIAVNASVLTQQDISDLSTRPADEILRQVPGFSLLRSADSIATAPTTSTVSLRGLGGSAASRTLVLLDGMPVHSPYSSEVFWARIPRQRIESVEVIRGGGANAWGNLSLGGVINIRTERPEEDGAAIDATAGYPATVDLALSGHRVTDRWTLAGHAAYYDTDGYMNVPARQRGPVDTPVRKDFAAVSGLAEYRPDESTRWRLGAQGFREERGGGSALDVNTTEIGTLSAVYEKKTGIGAWTASVFYDDTRLEDASVRITGDNEGEVLRSFEIRPTDILGAGTTWLRQLGAHRLSAGADYRWSDVRVDEWSGFDPEGRNPAFLKTTVSSQDLGGVYVQDSWQPGARWTVNGSLRFDYVTNRGRVQQATLPGNDVFNREDYAPNSETTFNPSLGAVCRWKQRVTLRAAAYRGFRAATLRELYHAARIRSGVVLVNNPQLAPERLTGLEAGIDFAPGERTDLRLTVFRNTVEDLVQNITRGVAGDFPEIIEPCGLIGPGETCRELDNVGEMQATGLEIEAAHDTGNGWSFFLSYLYNDTEITRAPDNPQLVGNRVRQAPEHSLTARVRRDGRWFDTSILARYVGGRYEDDLNRLEVDGFLLFDLRHRLAVVGLCHALE